EGNFSENQFQAELNLPHLCRRGGNPSNVGIQSSTWVHKDHVVWGSEIRMVWEVEKLCPELEILSFSNPIVLDQRKIQTELPRPDQRISSHGAKITRRLDDKIRWVEIAIRSPVGKHRIIVSARSKVRPLDRKSTRLNSSHVSISYAVFCLKKKKEN